MVEIADDEYNRLLGRAQVADFSEGLYNDPKFASQLKAIIKEKYPHIQIPDYDIEQRVTARLDAEKKERLEAEKAKREAEDQERFKRTRSQVQKDYGFTDDAMKDLEKFMVERNIGDYEVAAEYHAIKHPKQSEANQSDGLWHHQQQEGFAEVAKDPEGWARKEILSALRKEEERQRGGR